VIRRVSVSLSYQSVDLKSRRIPEFVIRKGATQARVDITFDGRCLLSAQRRLLHFASAQPSGSLIRVPASRVETCRQRNGLANERGGAHIRGMEKYRSRMLEVTVTNRPPKWESFPLAAKW
jgi:hypothetical protein